LGPSRRRWTDHGLSLRGTFRRASIGRYCWRAAAVRQASAGDRHRPSRSIAPSNPAVIHSATFNQALGNESLSRAFSLSLTQLLSTQTDPTRPNQNEHRHLSSHVVRASIRALHRKLLLTSAPRTAPSPDRPKYNDLTK